MPSQPALPLDDWPPGFRHLEAHLAPAAQASLLAQVLAAVETAGWFQPTMPRSGRPMSVTMCNLGPLGWVTDSKGYRYQPHHPATGRPWPPIPRALLALWAEVTGYPAPPEACLVNLYRAGAKMGLHQDRDETDLTAPVALRLPGRRRPVPPRRHQRARARPARSSCAAATWWCWAAPARLSFHGIDRVLPGTSDLVPGGGRINLTLRRVTVP